MFDIVTVGFVSQNVHHYKYNDPVLPIRDNNIIKKANEKMKKLRDCETFFFI